MFSNKISKSFFSTFFSFGIIGLLMLLFNKSLISKYQDLLSLIIKIGLPISIVILIFFLLLAFKSLLRISTYGENIAGRMKEELTFGLLIVKSLCPMFIVLAVTVVHRFIAFF